MNYRVNKSKRPDPRTLFNPTLFWDAEDIDMERHASYIIARVLDYGDERDLKTLRKLYPDERLIEVIKKARGIMPMTARFWAIYFKLPLEEVECLKMYYQKRR